MVQDNDPDPALWVMFTKTSRKKCLHNVYANASSNPGQVVHLCRGRVELVNMTAEGGIFLFHVHNCVFVKEQLVSISLKERTRASH